MLAGSNISITGAASSIIRDDLPINKVVISDSACKISSANLSIGDIISGYGINLNNYYTKSETDIRLAFKQHLLDNTSGSGSTILNSNLIKRLVAGSNVSITESAAGRLVFASTGGSGGGNIPSTIADFLSTGITRKVPASCNLGLTVTNTLASDEVHTVVVRSNSYIANGASTVQLLGTTEGVLLVLLTL